MYCEKCFTVSSDKSTRCIQCGKAFFEEKPKLQSPTKKSNDGLGIFTGIAGLAVGLYSGIFILLLLAVYGMTSWCGKRFLNRKAIPFLPAIAVQASLIVIPTAFYFILYLKGLMPLSAAFLLIDLSLPCLGLIWLIKKPGSKPAIALGVFQLLTLGVNVMAILEMDIGTQNHKALANYIVWRLGALYLLSAPFLWQKEEIIPETEKVS